MCIKKLGILALFCLTFLSSVYAQLDSLIDSGKKLAKAKILSDSGKFDLAIFELKQINLQDTNYVESLLSLTDIYLENKQFKEAIETSALGLAKPSKHTSAFLLKQGISYTFLAEYDKAEQIFNEGIRQFPLYHPFLLQKGKMFYIKKEYDKAEKIFFEALKISPFNYFSHFYLGNLAILRGEKVKGMLALGLYMTVNNRNNNQLVLLERFVSNQLTDEASIATSNANPFLRLDGIIRSKVAFDEAYKTEIPINAGIVRQFQLLFEELPKYKFDLSDPYVKFYLPVYLELIKSKQYDSFVFHILSSSSIELVPKWTEKNKDKLENFYSVVNTLLNNLRQRQLASSLGYGDKLVSWWFYDSGVLESIGDKNDKGDNIGLWHFFYDNGTLMSKGNFNNNGNKVGVWHFYNDDGSVKSIENYDTGQIDLYYTNGNIWQKYFLINDNVNGEVLIYHNCGILSQKLGYKNGLRDGYGEVYSTNGTITEKFTYKSDSLNGKYEVFYDTGEKKFISNYKNGLLDGYFVRFHRNGNKYSEGNYVSGLAEGEWKFYHDNNQLSEIGTYKDDNPTGRFKYYSRNGILTEERDYNEKGEQHGLNKIYLGKYLHYEYSFQDGLLKEITYYDTLQNVIANYKEVNGILAGKSYYITGEVNSEFEIKDGKNIGIWKYYNKAGIIKTEYEYKNGVLDGVVKEYYPSGKLKILVQYADGERHGQYIEYYENGAVARKGWIQFGYEQQLWVSYHPNGKLRSEQYFLNGQIIGVANYYASDGLLYLREEFKNTGDYESFTFDRFGKQVNKTSKENLKTVRIVEFANGKLKEKEELLCNKLDGKSINYFKDGQIYAEYTYRNGIKDGPYKMYYHTGKPQIEGNYKDGKAKGTWKWYYANGQLESIGHYEDDGRDSTWIYYYENGKIDRIHNYERGNVNGVSKYFNPDGILLIEKKFIEDDLVAYRSGIGGQNQKWNKFQNNEVIRINFQNGKLALEEYYDKGELHGTKKIFYQNGNIYTSLNFHYGNKQGAELVYYPNGKIRSKLSFINNEKDGKQEWFTATGLPELVENYEFDILSGPTLIYQNGKLVNELNFWYGDLQ